MATLQDTYSIIEKAQDAAGEAGAITLACDTQDQGGQATGHALTSERAAATCNADGTDGPARVTITHTRRRRVESATYTRAQHRAAAAHIARAVSGANITEEDIPA